MTWTTPPVASNTISTDGIDINDWGVTIPYGPEGQPETVTLSTWDFAGQEIYYATHQFFLSARSLYFLVFNLLSPVQSHVEFWLQSIRNAAPDSPVFIIGSHADDERCTEEYTAAMLKRCVKAIRCVSCVSCQSVLIRFCCACDRLEDKYQRRFPNIAGFHFIGAPSGKGLDALHASLVNVIAAQVRVSLRQPSRVRVRYVRRECQVFTFLVVRAGMRGRAAAEQLHGAGEADRDRGQEEAAAHRVVGRVPGHGPPVPHRRRTRPPHRHLHPAQPGLTRPLP